MTQVSLEIELLLGTVNDVIVSAPMDLYQVADKIWQICFEPSVMISETPWHEIKRSTCPLWPEPITMEIRTNIHMNNFCQVNLSNDDDAGNN